MKNIGCECYEKSVKVKISDGKSVDSKQKIDLMSMDYDGFLLNNIRLKYGRVPKSSNEILLSAGIEMYGGYAFEVAETGSEIELVSDSGKTEKYTVVGVCDNFNAAMNDTGYKAYTYSDDIEKVNNVYVTVVSEKNCKGAVKSLAKDMGIQDELIKWDGNRITDSENILSEYHLICNSSLIYQLEEGTPDDSKKTVMYIMKILTSFILIVSIMVIWNIYSIFMNERRKEFGLLRVCGISSYKLLCISLMESSMLYVPALITSVVLSGIGKMMIQNLIQFMRIAALTGLKVSFSYELIILSALYVLVIVAVIVTMTTYMVIKDASPVQMLNGEFNHKLSKKEVRRDRKHYVTAGYLIGSRNITRNKGKSLSVILSLAVITLFFVVFSCLIEIMNQNIVNDVTMLTESQYTLFRDGDTTFPAEFTDNIPFTTSKYTASFSRADFNIAPEQKNDRYKQYYNAFWAGYTADEIFDRTEWNLEVDGIGREEYEKYVEWFDGDKPDYDEWLVSGRALLDDIIISTDKNGEKSYDNLLNIDAADYVLTYNNYDCDLGNGNRQVYSAGEVRLCGRVGHKLYCREDNEVGLTILLPEEVVRKQFDARLQLMYITTEKGKETEVGAWLKNNQAAYNYSIVDDVKKYAAAHDSKITTRLMLIMGFVLIVIICMLHIYNVVCSNLNSRKKELAILMAIGMKRWQVQKSVIWEHALYGAIGGIAGAIASILLLERLLMLMSGASKVNMILPLDFMWVGFCFAMIISMSVALYATRGIGKSGIVSEVNCND